MNGVTQAFSELQLHIEIVKTLDACAFTPHDELWDVLIVDLDSVQLDPSDPLLAVRPALRHARKAIAVVPPQLSAEEPRLRELGVLILHRPITTGELVLALNRMLRRVDPTQRPLQRNGN